MAELPIIVPEWPAPPKVRACSTTRIGGVSRPPYDRLNLGEHVGDDPQAVASNRRRLVDALQLPGEPAWLKQVHGCGVVEAGQAGCEADAVVAHEPGKVCAVLTADCLPVLLCEREGRSVAALHAGWRGLADGVIEAGVAAMGLPAERLMAWLGPAIGPDAFEVGEEVREAFMQHDPAAASAFQPSVNEGRWMADLYRLARQRLNGLGVEAVYGGGLCTYSDPQRFFSYRRDGATGRMASLIWVVDGGR